MPGQPSPADGTWPSKFAQVLAETLAGSRPPDQIVPWTTDQARRRIGQLGPLLAATHRPRVRRILVTSPASGVLEMTVIVGVGPRVRAVAVRLEQAGHRQSRARVPEDVPEVAAAPSQPVRADMPPFARHPGRGDPDTASGWLDEAVRWRCTAVEAA